MDSILDALKEGRLIELPDNDKFHCLQFLAHIIEAIPSVPTGTDVSDLALARENSALTGLGKGFACPHARVPYDNDLICSIGWSPKGIEYGAPDQNPVHIIIMYLVPDNQRNHYLKEVSTLARALMNIDQDQLSHINDLDTVRNYLLDMVSSSKSLAGSEARVRMIQLESRTATQSVNVRSLSNLTIEPITIISENHAKHIILSQNKELTALLDNSPEVVEAISGKGIFEKDGWRVIKRSIINYQFNRVQFECIAVKIVLNKPENLNNAG
ncbi:MAG: PTS sugar transporter subunit IIA [Bacteroidota bacterium]|nr:PTS sugar transporter subunit IIA [Bacteroidota bacterium]MDP4196594.1 PTS sugar transporter subunit IIA [Bacteroidota bacterium]